MANRNLSVRKKQIWIFSGISIAVLAGIVAMMDFSSAGKRAAGSRNNVPVPDMTGVVSTDFNQKITKSALSQQQQRSDQLGDEISSLKQMVGKMKEQLSSLSSKNSTLEQQLDDARKDAEKSVVSNEVGNQSTSSPVIPAPVSVSGNSGSFSMVGDGVAGSPVTYHSGMISNVQYKYPSPEKPKNPLIDRYIPSGTFIKAVILEGADANASVTGQNSTSPMLFRLTGEAFLPNDKRIDLSGCLVTASVYGDISSERGEVRLNTLSCNLKNNLTVDTPVQGHVAFAGKEGIRGNPVMRNGKIIAWAGLSGALSGIGSALQQSETTQSVSPLGVTNTVNGSQVWRSGMAGGAGTALSALSQYYIKRADQYHPVIEIGSNNLVTVIFQKGFHLSPIEEIKHKNRDEKEEVKTVSDTTNSSSTLIQPPQNLEKMKVPESVLKKIQGTHIGDTLSSTGVNS